MQVGNDQTIKQWSMKPPTIEGVEEPLQTIIGKVIKKIQSEINRSYIVLYAVAQWLGVRFWNKKFQVRLPADPLCWFY